MSSLNSKKSHAVKTHEGAPATPHLSTLQQLRRSVLSCLLWEDQFYEDGLSIADRIDTLSKKVQAQELADLAIEAKNTNLRHVPLLLVNLLIKHHPDFNAQATIIEVIRRADELSEFLAVYWRDGRCPVDNQVKKALAKAFNQFNAYQLAKYNRDKAIKLRDVLRLCHPKPKDDEQSAIFKKIIEGTLESPDTWEVALSAGANKKDTFTRLLQEQKLGYLALLRNLRNMDQAGVDADLIKSAILSGKNDKILPFRYVAAARACPRFEPELDKVLLNTIQQLPELAGETVVLVDVSGSMDSRLSKKSDLTRMDAACALASVIHAKALRVFSFSNNLVECPPRKGMAGIDAIRKSQQHGNTELGGALNHLHRILRYDRIIVITDEQSHDRVPEPQGIGYMINVASYQNGVGYGKWTHIDGFSENVIRWIYELESSDPANAK